MDSTGLAANIGFIGFDNGIRTAQRAGRGSTIHSFTDTVAKEPCGLIGYAQHALHLLGAHALLGRGHDMRCQQPLVQGNVASFHYRASADSELFAAIVALEIASHLAF